MTGPREMLRLAAQNRRKPMQPYAQPEQAPRQVAVQSSHATYTALMHSHDRMRTRHLPGQGGGKRA